MPAVIIGRGDICPSSTGQGSEDSDACNDSRKTRVGSSGEQIEECDEGKSGAGGYGNEEHKEGTLRVSIANSGRDGGKPFLRIAKPLILDDFVVMETAANDQGAEKGSICNDGMAPSDIFCIKLIKSQLGKLLTNKSWTKRHTEKTTSPSLRGAIGNDSEMDQDLKGDQRHGTGPGR